MGQGARKKHGAFRVLHDNAPLRIEAKAGRSRKLIVSFTSVGSKRSEWPPREFVGMASDHGRNHVICVTDISRCWMNKPGMARKTADILADYILEHGITNISAVGTSMGAYNALVLSKFIPFDQVVAFTPQFSVHPEIVPEENRWMWFRKQIKNWPHKDLSTLGKTERNITVFHGDVEDEKWHWERFPQAPSLRHFVFAGGGHNFVVRLKNHGVLPALFDAGIKGQPTRIRKLVSRLGGMSRAAYAGFEAAMAYFDGRRKLPRPAGI